MTPAAPLPPAPRANWKRYVPPPDRILTSPITRFDSPYDGAFITATRDAAGQSTAEIAADPSDPTNKLLSFAEGGSARINVTALVRGREFPGPWDLIGVRYRAAAGSPREPDLAFERVRGTSRSAQRHLSSSTPDGQWHWLWFEIPSDQPQSPLALPEKSATTQPAQSRPATVSTDAASTFILSCAATAGAFEIDDLVLAQSRVDVCASTVPVSGEAWLVRRKGRSWEFAWNTRVIHREPAVPFAENGYAVLEADPTRVLFRSPTAGTLAVNRVGRVIRDGRVERDAALGTVREASASSDPAASLRVEIISTDGNTATEEDGAGRIDRTQPGDHDNDGYDETRGCAVVRAAGRRIGVRLSARGGSGGRRAVMVWPILEVLDLPPGEVSVNVAGQAVPWATRLPDGRVVIELPTALTDQTDVQVRVR